MIALEDRSLRILMLTHLVARLQQRATEEFLRAGIELDQLERLRVLDAADIKCLAGLPQPVIGLTLDTASVSSGLRQLAVIKDVQTLQEYFIRNGASPKMMREFF